MVAERSGAGLSPRHATMAQVKRVNDGLPLLEAEQLARAVCPHDPAFKYRLVGKATYGRRRAGKAPLSRTEEDQDQRQGLPRGV